MFNKILTLKLFVLLAPILGLLLYRITQVSILVSDTNIYFYTAYEILKGQILYKDIIFTNLPFFPYVSAFYFLITQGDIYLFYLTAAFETVILALLIFYATHLETKKYFPSLIASLLFTFSFHTLINSVHQTGIYTAGIFALAAFICFQKRYVLLTGIFMSLCFLTKAYFLPVLIAIAFLVFTTYKSKQIGMWLLGLTLGLVPLLPTLVTAFPDLIRDVLGLSLNKPPSYNRFTELSTFLSYDFGLVIVALSALFIKIQRKIFWLILLGLFTVYFFTTPDFPYLYFGIILPFLCILVGNLVAYSEIKLKQSVYWTLITVILLIPIIITITYASTTKAGKIEKLDQILKTISNNDPDYIYGMDTITPAIAYLSGKPLSGNIVDVNPVFFREGILNKDQVTQEVIKHKTITVSLGFEYPDTSGTALPDIVNTKAFHKYCKQLSSYPIIHPQPINRLILFDCPGKE